MLLPYSTSSNSTRPSPPPQHQVFINFRGAEVRNGFLKTLVEVLREEQVNVYIDRDELRGKELKVLFTKIKKSKIAITIFSKRYTESKWCLDELVKIKEGMDEGNLEVLPIFFNVSAEDVKDLEGDFGRNFRTLERTINKSHKMKNKWKDAIKSVSGRLGLTPEPRCSDIFNFFGFWSNHEKDFAEVIAVEVKRMLRDISEPEPLSAIRVFALVVFIAYHLFLLMCGVLYISGSLDNRAKFNGNDHWFNNRSLIL